MFFGPDEDLKDDIDVLPPVEAELDDPNSDESDEPDDELDDLEDDTDSPEDKEE